MGHFVSSPREREKRDSRGDDREGQGRKRNRNESVETEEIKTFPPLPLPATKIHVAGLPNCKPISDGHPVDARYVTPLPYLTNPLLKRGLL